MKNGALDTLALTCKAHNQKLFKLPLTGGLMICHFKKSGVVIIDERATEAMINAFIAGSLDPAQ